MVSEEVVMMKGRVGRESFVTSTAGRCHPGHVWLHSILNLVGGHNNENSAKGSDQNKWFWQPINILSPVLHRVTVKLPDCFASAGKKMWTLSTWFTCAERIRIVPGRQNRFYEAAPVLPAWNGGDIVGGWKIAKSGAALEDTLTAIPFNHCHWQSLGREIKTSYPRYLIWCWTRVISNTLKKPCHSCR